MRIMSMELRFWGVRGSIATPGAETAGVGGNTSCVEVRAGRTCIVLDAGTGIRRLGDSLLREGVDEVTLLLSHLHWDHIQGLPFFAPAYLPRTKLAVVGAGVPGLSLRDALAHQMMAPVFPVRLDELACQLGTRECKSGDTLFVGNTRVSVLRAHHPGGVMAFRIEHEGRSVVYATDVEHFACVDPALCAFTAGADVLIYDSQYSPEEYSGATGRSKLGWGHSTFGAGAELAHAAGVGTYVLFHHDPTRTDAGVAELEQRARALFPASVAAREGLSFTLDSRVTRAA
jgi:phosphoribosyl 1,2-cyclic phosphodiesterase